MSIQSGDGVLEILDGTLKVSRLDIQDISGLDVAINTTARNMVLLRDDQTAATVPGGGVSASSGISRDTGNQETVFTGGYVYWPVKVPNAWTIQFKVLGALIFSFSNTSEPTSSVASDNHGGYKLVFDSVNNRFSFYYQGSEIVETRTDYDPLTLASVLVNYEYGGISVVIDDDLVMHYALTHGEDSYTGEYVGFAGTGGAKVKDIKLTNGDKWQYTADSNASSIAYLNGNVGIGTSTPQKTLDVRGDARVSGNLFVTGTTFTVDSQNLSIKDKIIELAGGNTNGDSNVGMILTTGTSGSNVAVGYRGDESELMIGFTSNIATDNALTPKPGASLATKIYGTLETTGSTTASAFSGDGSGLTNVTFAQVVDYGNMTSNTVQFNATDVALKTVGNVAIGTTTALIDLAIGDANTGLNQEGEDELAIYTGGQERLRVDASGHVGIGVSSPTQSLHVVGKQYINGLPQGASVTDDGANLLVTGQTTSTTPESLITITRPADSGTNVASKAALKLSRWSADTLTASRSKLDVTLASGAYTNEVTPLTLQSNQKVGIMNTSPEHTLSVGSNLYIQEGGSTILTVLGNADVSGDLVVDTDTLKVDASTGRVGIGTTSPGYTLDVHGTANVHALTVAGGLTVDTSNLIVRADTGHVGIGLSNPASLLHMKGPTAELRVESTSGVGRMELGGPSGGYIDLKGPFADDSDVRIETVGEGASIKVNGVHPLNIDTDGSTRLTVDGVGNVGIGTTNPIEKVHIYVDDAASSAQLFIENASTSNRTGLVLKNANGEGFNIQHTVGGSNAAILENFSTVNGGVQFYAKGDGDYQFRTTDANTLRMSIQNDGKVGIGTTSPTQKLDVNGTYAIKGKSIKRTVIGHLRYTLNSTVIYNAGTTGWQDSWTVTYTRVHSDSKIHVRADLCLAQAMGATNSVSYRAINGRIKVNSNSVDYFSNEVIDWQRIDNSFHEYQRQSRVYFDENTLSGTPAGGTISITAQVSEASTNGTVARFGLNVWSGTSYIEVFEFIE